MLKALGRLLRRPRAALGVASVVVAGCVALSTSISPPFDPLPPPRAAAYHAWWMGGQWHATPWRRMDRLFFFAVEADGRGSIVNARGWPERWRDLSESTRAAGIPLDVTLTVLGDQDVSALFSDPQRVLRLTEETALLLEAAPGVGLHLDVEAFGTLAPAAIAGYRRFVRDLRRRILALPRRVAFSGFIVAGTAGAALHDRQTLELFDFCVVQGYDSYEAGSERSGPVAALRGPHPATWESALKHLTDLGLSPQRMLFSVPLYAYEWPTRGPEPGSATRGKGRMIPYGPVPVELLKHDGASVVSRTDRHGSRRDELSGSPYYVFEDKTGWHQGWYEDEPSLRQKLEFARSAGVSGAALFVLGYDDNRLADIVIDMVQPPR
ncbi:MAG: hypothetical protein HY778_14940 [Betaproteobacteria bacterium]|nr:hypothetical protein [Betaproteobacteria bacterium]